MAMGSKNQILAMATGQRLGPGTDQLPAMATDQRPAMAMPTSQRPGTATNQRLVTATGQCPATVIDTNQCPGADVPLGRQPIHQIKNPLRGRRTCPHLLPVDDDLRARTLPYCLGAHQSGYASWNVRSVRTVSHLALIGLRPPAASPHQYGRVPTAAGQRDCPGLVVAPDDQQLLAWRAVPARRIIVHAAVAHVQAVNDAVAQRSAALDNSICLLGATCRYSPQSANSIANWVGRASELRSRKQSKHRSR